MKFEKLATKRLANNAEAARMDMPRTVLRYAIEQMDEEERKMWLGV